MLTIENNETITPESTTAPVAAPVVRSIELSREGKLLLIRLLAAAKPPTPARVVADLAAVLGQPLTGESLNVLRADLLARGLIQAKPLALTDAGRAAALSELKLDSLPTGAKWETLLERFALPIEPKAAEDLTPSSRLLLIDLLAHEAAKPRTLTAVAKDLNPLRAEPLTADSLKQMQRELKQAGLLDFESSLLTASGRSAALSLLKINELPPGATFASLHDRLLHPVDPAGAHELSRPAQLFLARLLIATGPKAPAPAAVRKQLEPLFPQPLTAEAYQALLAEVKSAGLVSFESQLVTEAGRAAALSLLGVDSLPEKTTWKNIVDRYLFPTAAGIGAGASEAREHLQDSKRIAGFLVKRQYGLQGVAATELPKVLDALVCKELGFPGVADWANLRATVLSRVLKSPEVLKGTKFEEQLPRVAFDARSAKPDDLRQAIIKRWLGGVQPLAGSQSTAPRPLAEAQTPTNDAAPRIAPPSVGAATGAAASSVAAASSDLHVEPVASTLTPTVAASTASLDLPAFAALVTRVARSAPAAARFGDNKVFINHAWRLFQQEPIGGHLDLPAFKARLIEANHENLLQLSRADLVSAMDPTDVRESQTRYLTAEWHFILLEGV